MARLGRVRISLGRSCPRARRLRPRGDFGPWRSGSRRSMPAVTFARSGRGGRWQRVCKSLSRGRRGPVLSLSGMRLDRCELHREDGVLDLLPVRHMRLYLARGPAGASRGRLTQTAEPRRRVATDAPHRRLAAFADGPCRCYAPPPEGSGDLPCSEAGLRRTGSVPARSSADAAATLSLKNVTKRGEKNLGVGASASFS